MAPIVDTLRSMFGVDDSDDDYEVAEYVLERRVPDPNPRVTDYNEALTPGEVIEHEDLPDGEYILQELKSTGSAARSSGARNWTSRSDILRAVNGTASLRGNTGYLPAVGSNPTAPSVICRGGLCSRGVAALSQALLSRRMSSPADFTGILSSHGLWRSAMVTAGRNSQSSGCRPDGVWRPR